MDEMAGLIVRLLLTMQRAFAGYLHKKTGTLSGKKFKTALVLFCLLSGGFSSYLLVTAVVRPDKEALPLTVEAVQTPEYVGNSRDVMVRPDGSAEVRVIRKIRAFRHHMDSLRKNKAGLYDSILTSRPGLMDSFRQVEEMYHSQKTK
jgi:hypothetical protein